MDAGVFRAILRETGKARAIPLRVVLLEHNSDWLVAVYHRARAALNLAEPALRLGLRGEGADLHMVGAGAGDQRFCRGGGELGGRWRIALAEAYRFGCWSSRSQRKDPLLSDRRRGRRRGRRFAYKPSKGNKSMCITVRLRISGRSGC